MKRSPYLSMVALIVIVAALALASSSCGTDPLVRIADNTEQSNGQEQWSDGDNPPYYSTTNADMTDAQQAFDMLTPSEKRQTCDQFWSQDDQTITDDWLADGFTLSEVNAVLNVLWRECS